MKNSLYDILYAYGLKPPFEVKQIGTKSVWEINKKYILKQNDREETTIEKVLMINNFLKKENISVAEYIKAISGDYYTVLDGNMYSLMRKMNGDHINYNNPFNDDYKNIGSHIGIEIARLHKALEKIGNDAVYESDLMGELNTWMAEIRTQNIEVPCEVINLCLEFDRDYHSLPKQLIHRDIQFGNMLFENDRLTCFLDFDSSQVNARLFDIVYFGQSILFNNYNDGEFVMCWVEFFSSLLLGYHSENMLYEHEMKSIHRLCVLLQIGFISYYSHLEEKRDLIPNRVDMAKWIYSNESLFTFSLPSV